MERTARVQRLQEHGCSVLCLDCPEGILFGIDYSAWAVGPKFMGIKLIPPGLHFVYSSPSAEEVGATRSGFFLFMRAQAVVVLRWDSENEELVHLENQDEEMRYSDGVRGYDFDANLGPYPHELESQWQELTRHASEQLVDRIEPVSKTVRAKRAEYDGIEEQSSLQSNQNVQPQEEQADEEMNDETGLLEPSEETQNAEMNDETDPSDPSKEAQNAEPQGQSNAASRLESNLGGGSLFFSPVPRIRKMKGTSAVETTKLHMDRSSQLEDMISRFYSGNEFGIIGELQLAYIAFLLGQNYDGFEQWKSLLLLLCSCESAIKSRPELYAELLRSFFAELTQAPQDLFGDDLTKENFLGSCAISLLELCGAEDAPPKLQKRCIKLRELVCEKFGVSIEDLTFLQGEDAPQVVDIEGRDLVDLAGFDGMD